jgi:hypothetical protein
MIHPGTLSRRALTAAAAAEATADRATLGTAQRACLELHHARLALDFLSDRPRPITLDSIAWRYRAFRARRDRARMLLRHAVRHIAEAEAALLAADIARAEAAFAPIEKAA